MDRHHFVITRPMVGRGIIKRMALSYKQIAFAPLILLIDHQGRLAACKQAP